MLQIQPVSRGNYRVWDDAIRQTYFVGSRERASGVYSRMLLASAKRPKYALRITASGYGVFELTPDAKRFTKENCRYHTACIKRAERVLQAFQEGLI